MTKHEYIVRISLQSKTLSGASVLLLDISTVREFASAAYAINTSDISQPNEKIFGVRIIGLGVSETSTQTAGPASVVIRRPLPKSGKFTVVIELTTHRAEWHLVLSEGSLHPGKGFTANQGFITAEVL